MTRVVVAGVCFCFAGGAVAEEKRDPSGMAVVLVKRAGVTAYEEVAEEFNENCRVNGIKVISFGDQGVPLGAVRPGQLVVTVGQEAFDGVMRDKPQTVIPTLAFHTPPGSIGPAAQPSPDILLNMLQAARPNIRVVATVYGPRSEHAFRAAQRSATALGLQLIGLRADGGPEAVRHLRQIVDGAIPVHAIWLPGDSDIISPQVFRYALELQLKRGLPVAATTRQQVHAGAFVSVDFSPRSAGKAAAELVNRILEGRSLTDKRDLIQEGARISINSAVARRLGVNTEPLRRMGAQLE